MYVCLKINASTYRSTKNPFWNTKTCWRERERADHWHPEHRHPTSPIQGWKEIVPQGTAAGEWSQWLWLVPVPSSTGNPKCPVAKFGLFPSMVSMRWRWSPRGAFSSVPEEKHFLNLPWGKWVVKSGWRLLQSLDKMKKLGRASGRSGTQCPRSAMQEGDSLAPHMQATSWRRKKPKSFKVSNMYSCISPPPLTEISLCDSWNMSF